MLLGLETCAEQKEMRGCKEEDQIQKAKHRSSWKTLAPMEDAREEVETVVFDLHGSTESSIERCARGETVRCGPLVSLRVPAAGRASSQDGIS